MLLNPETLRCIRPTSRIAYDLVRRGVIGDAFVQGPRKTLRRPQQRGPAICRPDQERNPLTGRCRKIARHTYKNYQQRHQYGQQRHQYGQRPLYGYQNTPMLYQPAGNRRRIPEHYQIRRGCRNMQDPLTGLPINPQTAVQLHDGTCVDAEPLHYKVASDHRSGRPATIPGNPRRLMNTEDFAALRTMMRYRNPAYKVPALKHLTFY
jgi:hypothetical protein